MSTRTRFEKEAKGNSEMAYWRLKEHSVVATLISSGIPLRSPDLRAKTNMRAH